MSTRRYVATDPEEVEDFKKDLNTAFEKEENLRILAVPERDGSDTVGDSESPRFFILWIDAHYPQRDSFLVTAQDISTGEMVHITIDERGRVILEVMI